MSPIAQQENNTVPRWTPLSEIVAFSNPCCVQMLLYRHLMGQQHRRVQDHLLDHMGKPCAWQSFRLWVTAKPPLYYWILLHVVYRQSPIQATWLSFFYSHFRAVRWMSIQTITQLGAWLEFGLNHKHAWRRSLQWWPTINNLQGSYWVYPGLSH